MTAGRPCCGNNNCFPVCPIAAKYDAATALPKIEAKGGKILANAVVYRIETGEKNAIEAVHFFDPDKRSHRVTAKIFVIACNGIETPKLLLLSKDERNPNGVANSSDQVGRNMMDQPKLIADLELKEPLWTGVGPVQSSSILNTTQGEFRSRYAGAMFRMENFARSPLGAAAALKKGLVGKALDTEIRRLSACTARLTVEHEILPSPDNRLTLSSKKDWLGINKPNIYYDVGDYVRQSAKEYTVPRLQAVGGRTWRDQFPAVPRISQQRPHHGRLHHGGRSGDVGGRCRLSCARSPQPVPAWRRRDAERNGVKQYAHHGGAGAEGGDAIVDQLKHG